MEEYRIIEGFETYEVSNLGNVRNINTGRILKTSVNTDGYKIVGIYNKKKKLGKKIHRLVADAFIPNLENKECVDHINGNRQDNWLVNLRWASKCENNQNKKMYIKNKLGYTGIRIERNKYRSELRHNNKYYHLGNFEKLEDAVEARLRKSEELFKEYQPNHEKDLIIQLNIKANTKRNIILKVNIEEDDIEDLEKEFQEIMNKK